MASEFQNGTKGDSVNQPCKAVRSHAPPAPRPAHPSPDRPITAADVAEAGSDMRRAALGLPAT